MEDFNLDHRRYVNSGQRIGIIDDKAYAVSNVYFIRGQHNDNNNNNNNNTMDMTRPSYNKYRVAKTSYNKNPTKESRSWYSTPEFKRKKRVAKYKLYSMEGKVKASFKNGYRWFKHTCSRIIHGF
ncbi:putative DNA helicase hus2 [Capsicum annuum]|nr:putative DNA helicase hus2 [Capsicum annuum]